MTPHLADTPVLETDRLILRAPGAQDYAAWAEFAASDRAQYIGGPWDERQAWRAFGHVIGHWVLRGYGMFVFTFKDSDAALGTAGTWFPATWPEREIGWTVWTTEQEGRGLAFEAASAARDWAFGNLGWDTAVSYIDEPNFRSIALAERLGAVRDDNAKPPVVDDDDVRVMVYRHSVPGTAQ